VVGFEDGYYQCRFGLFHHAWQLRFHIIPKFWTASYDHRNIALHGFRTDTGLYLLDGFATTLKDDCELARAN